MNKNIEVADAAFGRFLDLIEDGAAEWFDPIGELMSKAVQAEQLDRDRMLWCVGFAFALECVSRGELRPEWHIGKWPKRTG